MDHGRRPFSMVQLDGPHFMVRFLKKTIYKAFGPLTSVNQMWTKKNDRAPNNECADFFNLCLKKAVLKEKNLSLTILLSSLGLHLSLLVKCVEDVAGKYSHNNFYQKNKNERFNIVHVQCNLRDMYLVL